MEDGSRGFESEDVERLMFKEVRDLMFGFLLQNINVACIVGLEHIHIYSSNQPTFHFIPFLTKQTLLIV